MRKLPLILFIYCLIVVFFVFISGMVSVNSNQELFFQLLFAPVAGYFTIGLFSLLTKRGDYLPEISFSKNMGQIVTGIVVFGILLTIGIAKILLK